MEVRARCRTVSRVSYKRYGGRGIRVCKEWEESFEAFEIWAIHNGFHEDLQIDRIDNSKGYSPENCRFVTAKENSRNRTNNHKINFRGVARTLSEWSEITGIRQDTLRNRIIRHGWSPEQALTTPVRRGGRGSRICKR